MLSRGALFGLGLMALLAGLGLTYLWFNQPAVIPTAPTVVQVAAKTVLVATHAMPAGSLLRPGDMTWEEKPAGTVVGANIVQGSASETDFIGAATRRAFAAHEPLVAPELAKPGDREFLVAALGKGYRAVSINVDAVQSTSGLLLPGDHVDVVLTQTFAGQTVDPAHRTVGETVLHDLRVIAVDQTLNPMSKLPDSKTTLGEWRMPKTVTLEVTERQAAMLLVADQLGKVQLALRGQQDQGARPAAPRDRPAPTWAYEVSKVLAPREPPPPPVKRAQIDIIRGAKLERLCVSDAGLGPCQ